jgi:sirohydrochlorin ferrochelatase
VAEGIILLSHGSKSALANQELLTLRRKLEEDLELRVKEANLQFSDPDFWQAVEEMTKENIEIITIIPLFVFAGKHVKVDLPKLLSEARNKYPRLTIKATSHLANGDNLLKDLIKAKLNNFS